MCGFKSLMEAPASPVANVAGSSGTPTVLSTPTASSNVKTAATPPQTSNQNYGSGWHGT